MLVPPYTATTFTPRIYFEKSFRSSAICRQSSRVGLSTMACVCRCVGSMRCSKGMPKAAVFPVPVCAKAITSLPCPSRYGITSSCTGMGCSKPSSVMARRISSFTPNSSNVFNLSCFFVSPDVFRLPAPARFALRNSYKK